ncbi:MAG: ATP-dependent DNA helicase RecG [Clostridia bacterium]|nr:ATP-dependent DNA helicase RecG [Clostridia bacterium]
MDLNQSIQYIKGVGPARVQQLNKLGIYTLNDAITFFPRTYEDRGAYKKIGELVNGETVTFKGMVTSRVSETRIRKGMSIYKLIVRDETGSIILTWFNQPYIKNTFVVGKEYSFYGKVLGGLGRLEVQNPIFEAYGENKNTGKIIPIYPLTHGITQNVIRGIIENAIKLVDNTLEETLPIKIREKYNLCEVNYATYNIHFPKVLHDFEISRYRIAFEELFMLQMGLFQLKAKANKDYKGISFNKKVNIEELTGTFPYSLTNAQNRVWNEIAHDMESENSMNRLVQGDVGSGKTVVAMMAMYKAVKNGYQAAMMAPTAILARQHYNNISKTLEEFGVRCALFTSELTKKQKEILIEKLKNNEIDIAIGTHALLEENIEFNNLGLVITDEQHRFGVRQRGVLSSKGNMVDTLVMTATPIPRTLAIILYGDLDISIIDELPPGRKKIDTYAVKKDMETRVNSFIKKEIDAGRQVYIVCPLVEESETTDLKSVTEQYEYYKEIFKEYNVAILHGKMKNKDKAEIMEKYKNNQIDVLISTTVIEVGVDVPNATLMVIENAERFGLAQLHQLRGRVGRGEHKSYCILKYSGNSEVIKERMQIMQQSNDGFVISEKDLELRGPGDFFGTVQHGVPEFKVANLYTDIRIMKKAQEAVKELLDIDPLLEKDENSKIREKIDNLFNKKLEI